MKPWKTIPFAAAFLVLQAQSPFLSAPIPPTPDQPTPDQPMPGQPAATAPALAQPWSGPRADWVQGTAKALRYKSLPGATKIDFKGTHLVPDGNGTGKVKGKGGITHIIAKFSQLPPPTTFGAEYLTYVLWAISPEGRANNLGEVLVHDGKGKIEVTEPAQAFSLVVTAEPYFAVSQPSDAVILENAVPKDTEKAVEQLEVKYDLLKRGHSSGRTCCSTRSPTHRKS